MRVEWLFKLFSQFLLLSGKSLSCNDRATNEDVRRQKAIAILPMCRGVVGSPNYGTTVAGPHVPELFI